MALVARLRPYLSVLALLFFVSSRDAFARGRDETAEPVSLVEAQRRAQAMAPDVVLAVARADLTRADVDVAGILPSPRLNVGTTTSAAVLTGSLSMFFPLFGQRGKAMDAAEAQVRVAEAGTDVTRLDARLAVTLAWLDLWQLQEESRIANDNADRHDRILDMAKQRFSEGAAPRLEVLRAETDARRTRAEVSALEAQVTAASSRLAVLLGSSDLPKIQGDPRLVETVPDLAQLDAMANEHPLLVRARLSRSAADAAIARERRTRVPLVGAQIGGSFFERYPPPSNDVSFQLMVDLPIFNGALTDRAIRARQTAQVELQTMTLQLQSRIASARSDYVASVRRQDAQIHQVLPTARETADLSQEAYRSGGLDLTSALATEQALSDARLAAVRSTADRARALGALEHATGRSM